MPVEEEEEKKKQRGNIKCSITTLLLPDVSLYSTMASTPFHQSLYKVFHLT